MKTAATLFGLLLIQQLAFSQEKVVLIEQFTNSGCPPCASYSPVVSDYVEQNPSKLLMISYHTGFPYLDSMYHENKTESNASVAYYGVQSVPYTVLAGKAFTGPTYSFNQDIDRLVSNELGKISPVTVRFTNLQFNGKKLSGTVVLEENDAFSPNSSLKIAVIEKNVFKNSYAASPGKNSETVYKYVMRKMLPDFSGTRLNLTDGKQEINFSWDLQSIKSISELRVVAFVQNNDDKEVYQAMSYNPSEAPAGINDLTNTLNFIAYPNPVSQVLKIANLPIGKRVSLRNIDGRLLASEVYSANGIDVSSYAKGIYFIQTESGSALRFIKE